MIQITREPRDTARLELNLLEIPNRQLIKRSSKRALWRDKIVQNGLRAICMKIKLIKQKSGSKMITSKFKV